MKKVLFLTLSFLLLGGIQAARIARAGDDEVRLCRQAAEEVKKTQEFMERAAPRILACADDSAKALFARARHAQAAAREALSNRRCKAALELTQKARRLTLIALKRCGDTNSEPIPDEPILAPE
ncbi:MAG: hypothetical protein L0Z48_07620 [candidate division Zixibacteria bacterium]|nr:hypothetical protein [candidate division Zixibacteria bacterium]MCI0596397.1 hypothetical protein [candidate division Zixibacteria bacterium]